MIRPLSSARPSSFLLFGVLAIAVLTFPLQAEGLVSTTVGGFWTTLPGESTVLVVNNPRGEPTPVTLRVYSHTGRMVHQLTTDLPPSASWQQVLHELVIQPTFGHLELEFPAEVIFLPAQLQVSSGESDWASRDRRRS